MRRAVLVAAAMVVAGVAVVPAHGAPSVVRPFVVAERPGTYAVSEKTQRLTVAAGDGTQLFVETWLPAAKGKAVPPKRGPVVVVATPYALEGVPRPDRLNAVARWTTLLVSRGYALANVHLRGTGLSGGCWGNHDAQDADDVSRAVEAVTKAPFSDGRLALFGKSHDGGAALNAAARGDSKRLRGVKAVVVASPVLSYADFVLRDGLVAPVERANITAIEADTGTTGRSALGNDVGRTKSAEEYATNGTRDPLVLAPRAACRSAELVELQRSDGRMTPWLLERENARLVHRISTPVLWSYGLEERQSPMMVGTFDSLRGPQAGVVAASGHDYPDQNTHESLFSRYDWEKMVIAWLDRWLLGRDTGVRTWPKVQVQSATGQWRAETGFPRTAGPAGRLALGPGGVLGASRPTGSTAFRELTSNDLFVAGGGGQVVQWRTAPLKAPLHLTGQAVADLWVQLDMPVAHVSAELKIYSDRGGLLQRTTGRSTQYLAPLAAGRFVQPAPVDPPVGKPVRLPLRFPPLDIVVPAGGTVELRLVGVSVSNALMPSGRPTQVTVLHDCTRTSQLTFQLPRARQEQLVVATDAPEPEPVTGLQDGGGVATRPAC